MKKKTDAVTFCRTMYCEDCFKAGRAFKGDYFFTFGGTGQGLDFHKASRWGVKGFTPHIITFDRVLADGRMVIIASCAMLDCGWELIPNPDDEDAPIPNVRKARRITLEALDYAALKKSCDHSYRLD